MSGTLPADVAFPSCKSKENVGRVLSASGLRQLRLTETEKNGWLRTI